MTTLDNRPNTALLVVDVQNGVVAGAPRRDQVVANIAPTGRPGASATDPSRLGARLARRADAARTSGRSCPSCRPTTSEPLIHKQYGDAFEATELESVLSGLGIGRLIVAGAQTDMCIRSTLHGALARGYDATLVADAHTTEDLTAWGAPPPEQVISHTNMYWGAQTAPGRTAGTVETADVSFTG